MRLPCVASYSGCYARKVNARELLRRSLRAARRINKAAVLVRLHVPWLRQLKCIQADGGHYEQLE
jgi:hypothetical protein